MPYDITNFTLIMDAKISKGLHWISKKHYIFILFLLGILFSVYLLFFNLGQSPLENWDEAFYGQVTKEMLQTKNIITLHWNNGVWFEKPPMFIWITSLFSLAMGLSELSLRLPSAISALIIISILIVYCYRHYSFLPTMLAFFTLVLNNVFIWRARSGNIDLFVSLLIFLTYFLLLSKKKYKYLLLGFLFFCIYFTKASLVVFPLTIFILNELIYQRKTISKKWKEYGKLFTIFIGLSGIWLLLGYLQNGEVFLNNYVLHADFGAAAFSVFNPNYFQHIYYSLQRRFFWLFLLGIILAILKIRRQQYFLLLMFACLLPLQLSFTARDNNWYLIPSMPFWSILIGLAVYSVLKFFQKWKIGYFTIICLIVVFSSYIFYKTFTVNILPILNSLATVEQKESAGKISFLTKPNDVIVRLDPLIPTTLYYANRKTLAYSPDTFTHGYWIDTEDLEIQLRRKKIKWLTGTNSDIELFFNTFDKNQFEKIAVNKSEAILKLK